MSLFSLVTLLAQQMASGETLPVRQAAWYTKPLPTFSGRAQFQCRWCRELRVSKFESVSFGKRSDYRHHRGKGWPDWNREQVVPKPPQFSRYFFVRQLSSLASTLEKPHGLQA